MSFYLAIYNHTPDEVGGTGNRVLVWDGSITPREFVTDYEVYAAIGIQPDGDRISCLYRTPLPAPRSWYVDEYSATTGAYLTDRPSYDVAMPDDTRPLHGYDLSERPALHPDGSSALLQGQAVAGGVVTLYKATVAGYSILATIPAAFASCQMAISPNGQLAAVAAPTPTATPLRVLQWSDGAEIDLGSWWLACGEPSAPTRITSVLFSPYSDMLAVCFHSATANTSKLVVLDAATGALIGTPRSYTNAGRQYLHVRGWTNSNKLVLVVAPFGEEPEGGNPDSGPLRVYHFAGGDLAPAGNISTGVYPYNTGVDPNMVAVIPGTEYVAVRPFYSEAVKLWSITDGSLVATLTQSHGGEILDITAVMLTKPVQPPPPPVFWANLIRAVEYP